MSWNEVVIEVPREHAESLSDAMLDAGALSVSVEDADEGTEAEQPIFGEPGMEAAESAWNRSRIVALLDAAADAADMVAQAARACRMASPLFAVRPVAEQDWVRLTQSQFDPIRVGERIWVVPSWHEAPEEARSGVLLELDPGLAFGTGSHPTTRLCMEWLERHCCTGMSVLDYGCGSGILAMVAAKLGAHPVDGVDIDPQAVTSARDNANRNRTDIAFFLPDDFQGLRAGNRYDIVIANILAGPLQMMAPALADRIAPGGSLVLSGILERQAEEVIDSYAPFIQLSVWKEQEGWVALSGRAAMSS
jgi:ribosomal protein L11 methyltransferase